MKALKLVVVLQLMLVAGLAWLASTARAEVVRVGQWPVEENISLSLDASPRKEAVQKLASMAGWSLITEGLDDTAVSVDVRDQPADKVLTLLLAGGDYEVTREGTLVSVRPRAGVSPAPGAKPLQTPDGKPGEDLFVTERGYVGKDQVVRDLFVVGSAVVEGHVTGSVVLFGGTAHLVRGARVSKDVIAFGGSIEIDDGVEIGGDVAALFGALRRGDGPSKECSTCDETKPDEWSEFFTALFSNLTSAVMAWLLGALMLALGGTRLNLLREEIERRPLRNLGVGAVTLVAALILTVTLVLTLLGIPLAVLLVVVGVTATYLAFSALPLAVGRKLAGKRSSNPYVHLAAGCGVLFVVLCVPVAGGLVSGLGGLVALGALSSTRGAGVFKRGSSALEPKSE